MAAGRQIVLRTTRLVGVSRFLGQARRLILGVLVAAQEGVDLAGDVAFEYSDDLAFGESFLAASGDVGAGAGLVAHAGDHDPP